MYHKNWWKTIDEDEDLDLSMPVYNLIEEDGFWFYSEGEATAFDADLANENDFKFFKCKAKLLGNTVADGNNTFLKTVTIALPFKYVNHSKYHWLSWIEA